MKNYSLNIFIYSILAILPNCITVPPLEVKVIRDKKDVIFEFYDQARNNDKEFPFVIHLEVFSEECMTSELEDEGECSVWSTHINWPPRKRIRYGEMQEGMDFFRGPKKLQIGKAYILKAHTDMSRQEAVVVKFIY